MAQIKVLDPLVADMIAAGEVVERPASVVKELVENAIDAEAGKITVELKNGGVSFLRVSDDGCGIGAEDVATAFLRHATSKITDADDLFRVGTLGFRGEALASIAAVSRLEVMTKPKKQQFGIFLGIKAGRIEEEHEVGCPDGTTIIVRDLFFNQPARMKFLKRDAAETAAIQDVLIRLALGNPHISFRLLADGKEKLHTPGDGNLKHCIYQIYGRDYAQELVALSYENEGISIAGFCGTPAVARSTRGYQTFFVNGRLIKSRGMTATLEQAYQDAMMKGKYPFAVISVELERSLTDVNVHPAKLEVKFSNEKAVMSSIYWAVKNGLHGSSYQPELIPTKEQVVQQKVPIEDPETLPEQEKINLNKTSFVPKWTELTNKNMPKVEPPKIVNEVHQPMMRQSIVTLAEEERIELQEPQETKELKEINETKETDFRVIGQLFSSYLVVQRGDEMLLIDQHAAHERFLFEQLLKQRQEQAVITQSLLTPVVLEMSPTEFSMVKEQLQTLISIGFELEEFGEYSLRLTGAPLSASGQDAESLFWETYRAMEHAGDRGTTESELLYSMACHAALKANQQLKPREMEQMVQDVLQLPSTCPHGRPIVVTMSKKMIEKQFKRIV